LAIAIAFGAFGQSPATAKETEAYVKEADQYLVKGNLKAAEIELRNAVRLSPQDPLIRARLADVYLRLGEPRAAEREARAARERDGNEADYLPLLAGALLGQGKYDDVLALITPGDRLPALESNVRLAIGLAALGLGDLNKAEALMREAIGLDQGAQQPKIALARLLMRKDAGEEADRLIEEVLAANSGSTEALEVKGKILQSQGDPAGAMQRFDDALKIDSNNVRARLSRATLNISQDKLDAAGDDLNVILKVTPDNIEANYFKALILVNQRQFRLADEILERIRPNFSKMISGYYLHAITKFYLGQYSQAENIMEKYVIRVPADANAVRLIATAALRQGAASRAIGYLKPLADRSPADAGILTLLGNAYMADRKPALALQQFEKAAAINPSDLTGTRVAVLEMATGQDQQGLAELQRIFETESGAIIAGPTLALSELRAGRFDRAAEVASSLVQRDLKNPIYQTLLGMVRVAQRNYTAGESAYRIALANDQDFGPALDNLARLYRGTGRLEDAKKLYNDVRSRKPNEVVALLGLADIATAEQKWKEANDYINQARTAAPNDPLPGLKLINLYGLRQDWTAAKAAATELASQFPGNIEVLDAQGRVQIAAGEPGEATDTYRRAYDIDSTSLPILARYTSLLIAAKNFRQAKTVFEAAHARDPRNVSLKESLIRIEAEIGGIDAGLAKARNFANDDPTNSSYDRVMADLYDKAGRGPEALVLLEKAMVAHPSDISISIALAGIYSRLGNTAKAEAVLSDQVKADPMNLEVRAALAALYLAGKKFDEAFAEYTRLAAARPGDPIVLNNLAWLYQQRGDLGKARELAEQAVVAAPNDATMGDTLGWIILAQGDAHKALGYLAAANASAPSNPDIQYHLAMALHRAGRTADARALLEKLLSTNASFGEKPQAEQLLQQLKPG
jgi:putative PEP-CTERM system TPR-repeat lipoprotein